MILILTFEIPLVPHPSCKIIAATSIIVQNKFRWSDQQKATLDP